MNRFKFDHLIKTCSGGSARTNIVYENNLTQQLDVDFKRCEQTEAKAIATKTYVRK
jgi:hypothetical protein